MSKQDRILSSAREMYELIRDNHFGCAHCIGNPMVSDHSQGCKDRRQILHFIETGVNREPRL